MRRVLIVAYYFPPLGGIGSVRLTGFANHLPEYGWEPTVLAPSNGAYYRDPTLVVAEERVVRSRSLELSRSTKRALRVGGDDVNPARPGTARALLRGVARRYLYYPDAQIGWYVPAVLSGVRTMRRHRFDAILSSSYPVTAHLVARLLHRASGVPWVAEYRDPWSDLILEKGVVPRRAARCERSIAAEASGLVMTSPSWAHTHGSRWKRPVTVITNGCDGQVASGSVDRDRFILAHLGTMFPERQDLSGAWRAIRNLSGSDAVDTVRFIGEIPPEVRADLAAWGLADKVESTGFLPRSEATVCLAASSALLLAGPRDGRLILRGWIPAKLFEYLATDLPIIYVGHPGSDAADFLRPHAGCYIVDTSDVKAIMDALRASRGQRHVRNMSELTRRALSGRLAGLLDEVCTAGGRPRRRTAVPPTRSAP